jgi:hypothetical protein
MKNKIEIDEKIIEKLYLISVFENTSMDVALETVVSFYLEHNFIEKFDKLSEEEQEDLGLLVLMNESDRGQIASEEEVMRILNN